MYIVDNGVELTKDEGRGIGVFSHIPQFTLYVRQPKHVAV